MLGKQLKFSIPNTSITRPTEKKAIVVLLRWILVIASCYLILFNGGGIRNGFHSQLLCIFLIGTNVSLALLPPQFFRKRYFDHVLVVADVILISACIWLSGRITSDFYLLYFLVIMIAAVSESMRALIISALLIGAMYLALVRFRGGETKLLTTEILIRVPFFFVVALFHGYFAQMVRSERSEKQVVRRKLTIARQLRKYSDRLSASLDRSQIMRDLVDFAQEFSGAESCYVISRGSGAILAERVRGGSVVPTPTLVSALDRSLQKAPKELELENSPSVLQDSVTEFQNSGNNLWVQFGRITFLPLRDAEDSDLFLALVGSFDHDTLEYAKLLLQSAGMALKNSGQFQALVHEAEKRQELVRELGKALEFKSQFVANVSHELRTPIYSLLGYGELLVEGGYGELNGEQRGALDRIISNANSVLELINQVLDIAKLDAAEAKPRIEPGDLARFIKDIAETCAPLLRDKPVSLVVQVDPATPEIQTDWKMLRQIAMNLVSNAMKFTERGKVEVQARADLETQRLHLLVRDSGIGIKADKFGEIFQPFRQLDNAYTKRFAGTGLGLAITKKQVLALGGNITVNSELNQGSEFLVEIPLGKAMTSQLSSSESHGRAVQSLSS